MINIYEILVKSEKLASKLFPKEQTLNYNNLLQHNNENFNILYIRFN